MNSKGAREYFLLYDAIVVVEFNRVFSKERDEVLTNSRSDNGSVLFGLIR